MNVVSAATFATTTAAVWVGHAPASILTLGTPVIFQCVSLKSDTVCGCLIYNVVNEDCTVHMYVYITVYLPCLKTYIHCNTTYSICIHVHVHTTYNYNIYTTTYNTHMHGMYVCSDVCTYVYMYIMNVLCILYILYVRRYNRALLWK